jgi:outer membrane protein assembly factor BamB
MTGTELRKIFELTVLSLIFMFIAAITNTIPQDSVLMVPNSDTPEAVYMFDPFDGEYLGIFLTDDDRLFTPQCAIKGPDGNIYLSDQIGARGLHVYDTSGTFLYTYCDTSDGLYNVRGIDFRNDTLFVTSGDDYVAMFDAPHNRLPDFIASGCDPYDIHFLDDGRALISDILGDNIATRTIFTFWMMEGL